MASSSAVRFFIVAKLTDFSDCTVPDLVLGMEDTAPADDGKCELSNLDSSGMGKDQISGFS